MAETASLTSQIASEQASIQDDQNDIASRTAEIAKLQALLDQANLANGIESLKDNPDALTALQAVLTADGFNVTITFA